MASLQPKAQHIEALKNDIREQLRNGQNPSAMLRQLRQVLGEEDSGMFNNTISNNTARATRPPEMGFKRMATSTDLQYFSDPSTPGQRSSSMNTCFDSLASDGWNWYDAALTGSGKPVNRKRVHDEDVDDGNGMAWNPTYTGDQHKRIKAQNSFTETYDMFIPAEVSMSEYNMV